METPLSRRAFLARVGGAAAAAAGVAALPEFLRVQGWYHEASALEADVTLDTFNAAAAFAWPGDDDYSIAQGESTEGPGAIAADAGRHIMEALDVFVPAPDGDGLSNDETLPLSPAIAAAINSQALAVNPLAANGTFTSPFARLSFAEKAATWQRLEEETQALDTTEFPEPFTASAGVIQFVFGVLPGFIQFFAFSEIDVWDPATRTVTARPVGWEHSGYLAGFGTTPPEGHDELIGFYAGRRAADRN